VLFCGSFLGKGRLTGWLLTLGLVWFIMNMLLAPDSAGLRQEVVNPVLRWLRLGVGYLGG